MNVYTPNQGFQEFLHFIACCKRHSGQWRYFHISLDRSRDSSEELPLGEILQFISFNFQRHPPTILNIQENNQLIVLANPDNMINLNKFEKGISEHFQGNRISVSFYDLEASGLERLCKILSPYIQNGNAVHSTLMKRLGRTSNMIMVLDDDPIVTQQLEKVMAGFGAVYTMNDPKEFLTRYQEYAPDILFLDLHLKTAMGNELLHELTSKIDPYAYVIIVSSDTEEKMVMDIKAGGAKGFLVKPFNRNQIFQHMSKVPTLALRSYKKA